MNNNPDMPEKWRILQMVDIVVKEKNAIKRGPWGGSLKKEIFIPKGYKVYEQKNVIRNNFQIGQYYVDEKKYKELEDFSIKPGDLLITGAGTIGKIAIVPNNVEKGIINQALIKISLNENMMLKELFKYFLEDEQMQTKITGASHGAAMKNFSSIENIKKMKVPVPPLVEQRGIAEVLGTLDEAIRLTDQVIERTEALKRGLMQRLLTQGIEHKEFKDTPLGRIPKTWKIHILEDVCEIVTIGVVNTATPYYTDSPNGIPYFRSQNVNEFYIQDNNFIRVIPKFNDIQTRSILKENDILTIQTGFIGRSCIVPKKYDGSNCHSLLITRVKPNIINPFYLCHLLNSSYGQLLLSKFSLPIERKHLLLTDYRAMKIPVPPLEEQNKISNEITKLYEKNKLYYKIKTNYAKLKQGLMQILLSGERRIELREDRLHRLS